MGDPERYRKSDEVHQWQENDPIGIYRRYLIENGIATAAELDALEDKAGVEIEAAVEFAESSPEPAADELFKDIYVEETGEVNHG